MKLSPILSLLLVAAASTFLGCAEDADTGEDTMAEGANEDVATDDAALASAPLTIDAENLTIRGIKLGTTATDVVKRFAGQKPIVTTYKSEGKVTAERYRYGKTTAYISYWGGRGRVVSVNTSSPLVKTRSGIGAGSTWSDVKAIRKIECYSDAEHRSCTLWQNGGFVYFAFKGFRVSEVTVASQGD